MIREARQEELDEVCRRVAGMDPWLRLGIAAEELRQGLRLDELRKCYVFEEDGFLHGAVICRPRNGNELIFFRGFGSFVAERAGIPWPCTWMDVPDAGYIGALAVFDGGTRHGIGLALIQRAEADIIEAGNLTAYLMVSAFNGDAQRFYESHGYQQVGQLQNCLRKGNEEHLMLKILGKPSGMDDRNGP